MRAFLLKVSLAVHTGVVHTVGGVTALIAAIVLGPRKGRFYDDDGNPLEEPATFPPHSVALQVLGTFILWFGT
jgi:ammonium transporter, Amt family